MVLDDGLIARTLAASHRSARGRIILPFHTSDGNSLHRMLNACQPGTYIRPHRHLDPAKDESLLLLRGMLRFLTFDTRGNILTSHVLGAGAGPAGKPAAHSADLRIDGFGIDIKAGVWHSFVVLEPDTILFECKPGPWNPANDKEFALWAPAEGTVEADTLVREWEQING